ncbi:MAG TPA: hypothetical protein DDX04_04925, partial [Massilia sp.]|nr:hypothetical protein [Massilia sp.]
MGADIRVQQRHALAPAVAGVGGDRRERVGDVGDRGADMFCLRAVDPVAALLGHGQHQAGQQHLVAVARQAVAPDVAARVFEDGAPVAAQHALVEALRVGHVRHFAKQDGDRLQCPHMTSGHHQAQGQRRRQQQADRPPQRAPEQRRDDHGQRRQA